MTPDRLHTELRKYASESSGVLSQADIDRAIHATVAEYVEKNFGYKMSADSWVKYVETRDKSERAV